MALIARWLLNGNLLDSSGNGNHLTYINNSGKLFSNSDGIVMPLSHKRNAHNDGSDLFRSSYKINLSGDFTMCCWLKAADVRTSANGVITNHGHASNSGAGITLKYVSSTDYRLSMNTGDGTTRTFDSFYGSTNIKDIWVHVALVYRNEKIYLFLNGVLDLAPFSYSMFCKDDYFDIFNWSTEYSDANNYRPAIAIQDVRVYDNALSDKEIYDLSKAKVLHYTFDDVEEPTVNLHTGGGWLPVGDNTVSSIVNIEDEKYGKGVRITRKLGANKIWYGTWIHPVISCKAGEIYTLSCYARLVNGASSTSASVLECSLRNTDWQTTGTTLVSSQYQGSTLVRSWRRFYAVIRIDSDRNLIPLVHSDYCNVNEEIEICGIQLEKKDHPTAYLPYGEIRDNVVVKDKSDYGNDSLPLTVSTTPAFVDDCKIGKQGTDFSKAFGKTIIIDNFVKPKSFTVCTWAKIKDKVFTEQPGRVGHNIYTNNDGFCFSSELMCWVKNSNGRQSLPFNGAQYGIWGHYCFTYDEATGVLNTYLNGSLCDTRTLTNKIVVYGAINSISISLSNYPTNGLMDDIRIYATALTVDDIKEIYQSRANLDDKGNFTVVSLNQQDVTSTSLTEKGIYNTINISEIGVTEGLIAHYPLNGDAKDYSGNGNDGTVVGATVSAGLGQKCYNFDGSTSKIILPRTFLRLPTFSCSLWFDWKNRDSVSRTLFSITENGGWRIGLSDGGSPDNLSFQIYDTSTYKWISIPNSTIPTGWNNISVSYDNISKLAILYINGVEAARKTLTNGLTYGTEVNPLIGCEANTSNANESILNGSIQDVRIYNRPLSPEEVLINYNLTKADKTAMIQAENGTTYVSKIKEV